MHFELPSYRIGIFSKNWWYYVGYRNYDQVRFNYMNLNCSNTIFMWQQSDKFPINNNWIYWKKSSFRCSYQTLYNIKVTYTIFFSCNSFIFLFLRVDEWYEFFMIMVVLLIIIWMYDNFSIYMSFKKISNLIDASKERTF
jgi:hypothetical protein